MKSHHVKCTQRAHLTWWNGGGPTFVPTAILFQAKLLGYGMFGRLTRVQRASAFPPLESKIPP
jgi:hypothetical protein